MRVNTGYGSEGDPQITQRRRIQDNEVPDVRKALIYGLRHLCDERNDHQATETIYRLLIRLGKDTPGRPKYPGKPRWQELRDYISEHWPGDDDPFNPFFIPYSLQNGTNTGDGEEDDDEEEPRKRPETPKDAPPERARAHYLRMSREEGAK